MEFSVSQGLGFLWILGLEYRFLGWGLGFRDWGCLGIDFMLRVLSRFQDLGLCIYKSRLVVFLVFGI